LAHMGTLVRKGLLGRWADGETHFGLTVEGLRTELPFYHRHEVPVEGLGRSHFGVTGMVPNATIDQLTLVFDGRADLVLALRNDEGQGFLQVVDLKTKDCRGGFQPDNPSKGTPLQKFKGDLLDPKPSTDAEREMLQEHRLQLTLYSLALEAVEMSKPLEEQRKILPPALLVGASGRVIQLSAKEFQDARDDLSEQLEWIGHLAAVPTSVEEPERLGADAAEPCQTCPFFNGEVRLCGPAGASLGIPQPVLED